MKSIIVLSVLVPAAIRAALPQPASVNQVKPRLFGDVGLSSVTVPRDTVDTLTTFRLNVGLGNRGTKADSGRVSIVIADTAAFRVVYAESVFFRIMGGTAQRVDFPSARFTTLGLHHGMIRLWTYRGSTDSLAWDFWVAGGTGVKETPNARVPTAKVGPTIMSASSVSSLAFGGIFDALGRRVQNPNPGVHFVRDKRRGTREAGPTCRLVIAE